MLTLACALLYMLKQQHCLLIDTEIMHFTYFSFYSRLQVYQRAQTLQTDWLQMHTKVSQRLTKLVDTHRLATEEFWLPLANLKGDLCASRRSIEALVSYGPTRKPLEPSTYLREIDSLSSLRHQLHEAEGRLTELRSVADTIISLLVDEEREAEKKALRNEVNSVLREVASMATEITASCDHHILVANDYLSTATNFEVRRMPLDMPYKVAAYNFTILYVIKTGVNNFLEWMTKAEAEFDSLELISPENDAVLKQIQQTESWGDSIQPMHEQLENLNWVADRLISTGGAVEG